MNIELKDEINDSVDAMIENGCLSMGPRTAVLILILAGLIAWATA